MRSRGVYLKLFQYSKINVFYYRKKTKEKIMTTSVVAEKEI